MEQLHIRLIGILLIEAVGNFYCLLLRPRPLQLRIITDHGVKMKMKRMMRTFLRKGGRVFTETLFVAEKLTYPRLLPLLLLLQNPCSGRNYKSSINYPKELITLRGLKSG